MVAMTIWSVFLITQWIYLLGCKSVFGFECSNDEMKRQYSRKFPYIGCFNLKLCLHDVVCDRDYDAEMDIDKCTNFCASGSGCDVAGLVKGLICICGGIRDRCLHANESDDQIGRCDAKCGMGCKGNISLFCGGIDNVQLYNVSNTTFGNHGNRTTPTPTNRSSDTTEQFSTSIPFTRASPTTRTETARTNITICILMDCELSNNNSNTDNYASQTDNDANPPENTTQPSKNTSTPASTGTNVYFIPVILLGGLLFLSYVVFIGVILWMIRVQRRLKKEATDQKMTLDTMTPPMQYTVFHDMGTPPTPQSPGRSIAHHGTQTDDDSVRAKLVAPKPHLSHERSRGKAPGKRSPLNSENDDYFDMRATAMTSPTTIYYDFSDEYDHGHDPKTSRKFNGPKSQIKYDKYGNKVFTYVARHGGPDAFCYDQNNEESVYDVCH